MLKLRCQYRKEPIQWPVSRKSRKLLGPEKPFLKLPLAHSVKLVFSCVVNGRKIKITAKFRILRRLRFEDTKRTMSPEMRPKSFGTFEKRARVFTRSKIHFRPKRFQNLTSFFGGLEIGRVWEGIDGTVTRFLVNKTAIWHDF